MNTYTKYKQSGVEWLPQIPSHWELSKAKRYFKYTTGFTPPSGQDEFYNGGLTWVTIADMNQKVISESVNTISQLAIERYNPDLTKKGSLLFSFKLSVGKVGYAGKDLYTNEAIISISPDAHYDLRYFFYTLPEQLLQNANENIYGAKMLNQELIRNASICFPPIIEQTAIANYLDEKTSQIEKLISKKQKLIELLKEERTAIINEAVSGEGKNWERKKLKYLTQIISKGTTPSTVGAEIISEGKVKFLKAENLLQSNIVSSFPENYIDENTNKILNRSELQTNDVLIVIAGATIGKVGILTSELLPANTNQAVCFIRLENKKLAKWVWLILQSNKIKETITLEAVQSAQPNLSMEKLGNFVIPIPKEHERKEIEETIQIETHRIDQSILKIKKEINLIQEYRTTLISEAVTGKIKVI